LNPGIAARRSVHPMRPVPERPWQLTNKALLVG
jgi:hypothetical protein